MILESFILGFVSSIVTEILTWLNKKLTGTVLQGEAAELFAFVVALIFSIIDVIIKGETIRDWQSIIAIVSLVYSGSQAWFYTIMNWLKNYVQVRPDNIQS